MVEVSSTAKRVIYKALKASGVKAEEGLRLERKEGKLTLTPDTIKEGDQVLRKNGEVILMVAPATESELSDGYIDVAEVNSVNQLVLRR